MRHRRVNYLFEITLHSPVKTGPRERAAVRKAVVATVDALPALVLRRLLSPGVTYLLPVSLVGDAAIHRLNRDYRGKDKPTDVLSFSRLEAVQPPGPFRDIGDLVLSVPTARRQAAEYGETLIHELQRLAVHGTLHLFGYDHETNERDARRMFRLQNAVLRRLSQR